MITGTYGQEDNGLNGSGVYAINPMLDFCGIMTMPTQLPTVEVSNDKIEIGGKLQ